MKRAIAHSVELLDPEWDDDSEFLAAANEAVSRGRSIEGVAPLSPWVSEMETYTPIRAPRRQKEKPVPTRKIGPGNLFNIVAGPASQETVFECIKIVDDGNWGLCVVYQTAHGMFAEPVVNCTFS